MTSLSSGLPCAPGRIAVHEPLILCSDRAAAEAASNAGEQLRADSVVAACLRAIRPGLELGHLLEDLEGSRASVGPVGADRHQGGGGEALNVVKPVPEVVMLHGVRVRGTLPVGVGYQFVAQEADVAQRAPEATPPCRVARTRRVADENDAVPVGPDDPLVGAIERRKRTVRLRAD